MKTSKWLKGLIMLIGASILPLIITLFSNGGHPVLSDWQMMLQSVVGIILAYAVAPEQTDPAPFMNINWKDFWHGLSKIGSGFIVGWVVPMAWKGTPKNMTEWWIVIGAAVSAFGTYILKALFTNSNGTVSLTNSKT